MSSIRTKTAVAKYAFCLAALLGIISSCSDDDNIPDDPTIVAVYRGVEGYGTVKADEVKSADFAV